jgi:hypothetical protein
VSLHDDEVETEEEELTSQVEAVLEVMLPGILFFVIVFVVLFLVALSRVALSCVALRRAAKAVRLVCVGG